MPTSIPVSPRQARWTRRALRRRPRPGAARPARRGWLLASWLGALMLGIVTQSYESAHSSWVGPGLGGVAYALAWCFGLALLRPTLRPTACCGLAVAICCAIEGLQLWHPHPLEVARATALGRLALGSGFAWLDLPAYAAGGALGSLWLWVLPWRRRPAPDFVRPMGVRP